MFARIMVVAIMLVASASVMAQEARIEMRLTALEEQAAETAYKLHKVEQHQVEEKIEELKDSISSPLKAGVKDLPAAAWEATKALPSTLKNAAVNTTLAVVSTAKQMVPDMRTASEKLVGGIEKSLGTTTTVTTTVNGEVTSTVTVPPSPEPAPAPAPESETPEKG